MATSAPLPFHAMTKPVGPVCNLDCAYCFYLEMEKLYPRVRQWRMPDEVLESYVRQYIAQQPADEIHFAWQGGEPTLLGVDFFRQVVALQRRYAGGKTIYNAIQTNGTLLDDRWGEFLARERFLVGLSIDGPRDLHDAYRVDKQQRPTFDAVIRGLDVLKRHGLEFNTLTVVHDRNSRYPLEVYHFLKQIGSTFLQFIPLVERRAAAQLTVNGAELAAPPAPGDEPVTSVTDWSVRPDDYGRFLTEIFDEWVRNDVGRVFVQLFEAALGNWLGMGASLCVFSPTCGNAVAVEHNGDVYSCDHYVYPRYRLGNLMDRSLGEMLASPRQRRFGTNKQETLPRYCRECDVRFACHGECPKHRFARTPEGESGLNYLCAAYKHFFHHIDPQMKAMAALLRAGQPAERIMASAEH